VFDVRSLTFRHSHNQPRSRSQLIAPPGRTWRSYSYRLFRKVSGNAFEPDAFYSHNEVPIMNGVKRGGFYINLTSKTDGTGTWGYTWDYENGLTR